jgi:hypothetical protein
MLERLPNELLAAIALQMESNNELRTYSLVCKRLRDVAQDVLLKPLKLPRNAIRKLLEMLIDRPDLAKRIRHVDLADYAGDGYPEDVGPPENKRAVDFDVTTCAKFETHVTKNFGVEVWQNIFPLREGDMWCAMRSFYLAILVLLTPNLHELTFEMRPLARPNAMLVLMRPATLLNHQTLGAPFHQTVMHLLSKKIWTLTIAENSPGKGPYMHNLQFTALSYLRQLSLPIDALISRNVGPIDLLQVWKTLRKSLREWIDI